MPTTRRSSGNVQSRTGPAKGQSTINFSGRITKNVPKDTTKALISPSVTKVELPSRDKPAEEAPTVEVETAEEPEEVEAEDPVPEKSEVELEAEKVTQRQIAKYWKGIEAERLAPRVHQQTLTLSEKVLRYFDVSSQYGPCIGIARRRRWDRAQRLGLNPPIEVLAILVQDDKGDDSTETAQIDVILNQTATAAA